MILTHLIIPVPGTPRAQRRHYDYMVSIYFIMWRTMTDDCDTVFVKWMYTVSKKENNIVLYITFTNPKYCSNFW